VKNAAHLSNHNKNFKSIITGNILEQLEAHATHIVHVTCISSKKFEIKETAIVSDCFWYSFLNEILTNLKQFFPSLTRLSITAHNFEEFSSQIPFKESLSLHIEFTSHLWYTYLSVIAVLDHQLFLIVVVLNCMDDLPKENP